MEISAWHCLLVINFSVIIVAAKPISLNNIIEAESKQKQDLKIPESSVLPEKTAERFSLKKRLLQSLAKSKKQKFTESTGTGKKTSPFIYKKLFQIRSPLKPKKLKYTYKPRHKRKNQSVKREIYGNEKLNRKYIPLLKNIGILFDNILNGDTGQEIPTKKYKRHRYHSNERNDIECACSDKSKSSKNPPEETTTISQIIATEISNGIEDHTFTETTTAATDTTTASDDSSFRQNQIVPLLLSRDSFSSRRDNNGYSEGSDPTHNRDYKRDITGYNGNRQHHTRVGESQSDTESYEETTRSDPRDYTSGNRSTARRIHKFRNAIIGDSIIRAGMDDTTDTKKKIEDNSNALRRNFLEHKENDKLEVERDKSKSSEHLPELIHRLRGHVPKSKNIDNSESIQSKEIDEKNILDFTSYKRVIDRGSTFARNDQEIRPRNEAITSHELHSPGITSKSTKNSTTTPILMIIDGYSVTRNKNGKNKLSEKSIRIQSKT